MLGLSSRSFLLFWLCVVHRIVSKEGSIVVLVSRVLWYMELKPGQWKLMIWEVWKGQSVWWWDGCMGCPWKIESAVKIYATLTEINCVAYVIRRERLRWFGHLERKSVDDWVNFCIRLVVEGARGRGKSRKTWEQCVKDDMKLGIWFSFWVGYF